MDFNTVLIVDDERALADTLVAILARAGYTATAVYSAGEAIERLDAQEPELVITDVIMPEMNGVELAGKIHARYPQTKILLMSGNAITQEILDAAGVTAQPFEILAKPVPPRQMLAKIASVMGK